MEKSSKKCAPKASPRPQNNPEQQLYAGNSLKIRYFERGLSKSL